MVLVPLVSLAAVRDTAPSEVRLATAGSSTTAGSGDGDDLARERLERFGVGIRSSRSGAALRVFESASAAAATPTTEVLASTAEAVDETTTTSTSTTSTTAKPTSTTAKPTTTTAKPTTTTSSTTSTTSTTEPATTSTMASQPACCREEGGASYHDYADPRTCAHKSLPKGTSLRVTNLANGKQTTCVVNDRGPYVAGRILDLSRSAFGEIANVSEGVIRVSIEW